MTFAVGIILLLVFACFAALMFLERISALLALPLMAAAFLAVAVCADLGQPATVERRVTVKETDAVGRVRPHVEAWPGPSRFEQWKTFRVVQADLLRERSMLLIDAADALGNDLEGASVGVEDRALRTLAEIRTRDQAHRQQAANRIEALPDFFANPPHHAGARADFWHQYNAISISDRLKTIATMFDREPRNVAIEESRGIIAEAAADGADLLDEHVVPDRDDRFFRVMSAVLYVIDYFIAVLRAGGLRLYTAIIATIFGGMFAMYVKNLKVAERLVYWTAEFAGERPMVITLAVFFVTAGIFTSVGGLGTVIMLGTIILPILRSIGLGPIVAAGVFLIAISMGGTLQPVARRLWIDFYGIPADRLDGILWTMVGLYTACGIGWIWWGTRRALLSSFCAVETDDAPAVDRSVPARLMVAPLIPVALVYFAGVEEISAFVVSIAYMFVCVCGQTGAVRVLARSLIEGAQTVMPPVLLMLGIGILITSLATPPVQSYLRPLLTAVVPSTQLGYILLFALAAPLALYRGPLNIWGMGLAVSATLLASGALPPAAILCAILAAGMLQGVCDPTNTANVWIAGFQGVTVNQILRWTILPVWAAAIAAVVIFGLWFVG